MGNDLTTRAWGGRYRGHDGLPPVLSKLFSPILPSNLLTPSRRTTSPL